MKKISIYLAFVLLCQVSFASGKVVADSLGTNVSTAVSAADLLNGTVAGLTVTSEDGNPYGLSNVSIRGINSLFNDSQPLWIVDGVYVSTDVNKNRDAFWQYPDNTYTTPQNPLAFLSPRDIESITVLKDISSTTVYGARGANGVIIVKTKRGSGAERAVDWSSNAGINFDDKGNIVPVQNHRLSLNGQSKNGATIYDFSLNYANGKGVLEKSSMDYGTLRASFETRANKVVHFGLSSIIGIGNTSSPFPGATWKASEYDDDSKDYRALISSWIRFNLSRSSVISIDASFDYQDNDRFIWYGKGTTFGAINAEYINGGAAAILESSMLSYNLETNNHLYGSKELLKMMFDSIIAVDNVIISEKKATVRLTKNSSLPVELKKASGCESLMYRHHLIIHPGETIVFSILPAESGDKLPVAGFGVSFTVENFLYDIDSPLSATITIGK